MYADETTSSKECGSSQFSLDRPDVVTLLIGGDVCPIGRNAALFEQARADCLFNDLLPEIYNADLTIVNLECPLITHRSAIRKSGGVLGASVACVNALKAARIGAVNLANNHILDHGEDGLRSTLTALSGAKIDYFGAGPNLDVAGRLYIRTINGRRIAFLGAAEYEFSIATKESGGANPLDLIGIVRRLRGSRNAFDSLVVLVHGGREHYSYPSPRLQKVCRFLVEEGAAAVICQHSHCVGCYEYYENAPIVYGQGNLVFDSRRARKRSWYEGFLVRLAFDKTMRCTADWIPFIQSEATPGASRMPAAREGKFLETFEERSREILVNDTVERLWREYCHTQKYIYASTVRRYSRLLRVLNKRLHFTDVCNSESAAMAQRNVVLCETHREILQTLWIDLETTL
jgi:poly-gamma-glutamate capsule biosynthesis protein CapA/YwtB (metallophosphatase superfamily)